MAYGMENAIKTFKTFKWHDKIDVIGAGATSIVYRAISECDNNEVGEYAAVKVFNDRARLRPNTLQRREVDILCNIKHENVVKLIDKDDMTINNTYQLRLLVMEYCNGGSLSNIIDLPENTYGLSQQEFLLVLEHITCGMNILHEQNIVHRDIKPNNILLQIMPNGEHVYKLSDFGAARQVEEDDHFTSLCGTEEYLFPDVYERALIDCNKKTSFRDKIDLWSTGVTLFHVATGLLPFRPKGGRSNRPTMIKITRDKPPEAISGVQNLITDKIEYSKNLPVTCRLSKKLQVLLEPMLAGLMQNNYDMMWSFEKFFQHSSQIYELKFIDVINLDTGSIVELALTKNEKLHDLKEKLEKETKIEKDSQLLIFNNLVFETLVNENQSIETYPIIDKEHPLVLFSLNGTLRWDNLNILKSIPELRCETNPRTATEIIHWSKEMCGSIYYIKREVYLVTVLIELLKLSAIAFKSYMPEMKLKQQNYLYNFKSLIKSLETKIGIIEKLKNCSTICQASLKSSVDFDHTVDIRTDINKLKSDITVYEKEIYDLTENINNTNNLEFLAQNSSLTSKWKNEIDALANSAQQHYNELLQLKCELRKNDMRRIELERFDQNLFNKFRIQRIRHAKNCAVKLYQETISVHFYDFYSKFEKWMSDLIKLHNDLMSVQQKLLECEQSINSPIEHIDKRLDEKISSLLESILNLRSELTTNALIKQHAQRLYNTQLTPPISPASSANTTTNSTDTISTTIKNKSSLDNPSSSASSTSTTSSSGDKEDMSNLYHSINSTKSNSSWTSFESLATSIREFKNQAIEIDKVLDENATLLKYLQSEFIKRQTEGESAANFNSTLEMATAVVAASNKATTSTASNLSN